MKSLSTSIQYKTSKGLTAALAAVWLAGSAMGVEKGQIVDRLLIELNRVSYSQRYIEIYSVVKVLLTTTMPGAIPVATESSWPQLVDDFRDDLLVDQEAKRVSGINIDKETWQAALTLIHEKSAKDPVVHACFARLGADDESLRKAVLSILGVNLFLMRKQKKDGEGSLTASYVIDRQAPWFIKLEQVTPYRFFEDAHKYVALSPMP